MVRLRAKRGARRAHPSTPRAGRAGRAEVGQRPQLDDQPYLDVVARGVRGRSAARTIGGAVGALARVGLATAFPADPGQLPWVTLVGNLAGAFALGAVLTWLTERVEVDPVVRLAIGTGVLGAITTYSTLAVEVGGLLAVGRTLLAGVYAGGSLGLGLLGAIIGIRLARLPARHRRGGAGPAAST